MPFLRKGSEDKSKPWYRLSSYRQYFPNKQCRILIFLCMSIMLSTYLLLPSPSYTLGMQRKSSFCEESKDKNRDICSFIDTLKTDSWQKKECHFKRPQEGRWLTGKFMTIWYKWTKPDQHCSSINVHKSLSKSQKIDKSEKFTIVINTWQRNECLMKGVTHYLGCDEVAQIRVIWSDPSNEIPHFLRDIDDERIVFDEYKNDKLTNRFLFNSEWSTKGIFQTDDDVMYSCSLLANTFKLWQLFSNYSIGFAPRQPYKGPWNENKLFYLWDAAYTECSYSLIFGTLGGFMHRKFYKMYSENAVNGWQQIKEYVDGNITAEDISMSIFHSFITGLAPITVIVPESEMLIRDFLSCKGEKSEIMHTDSDRKRTRIFLDIMRLFGYFDEERKFDLISSNLWVDVMPLDDQKCWKK